MYVTKLHISHMVKSSICNKRESYTDVDVKNTLHSTFNFFKSTQEYYCDTAFNTFFFFGSYGNHFCNCIKKIIDLKLQ